ncbi:MAG: GDSL-type esterase/lipase family protein [Alloprevotella sp.]
MQSPRSSLRRPVRFLLAVVAVCVVLHFVPGFSLGGVEVKPVDLLSDLTMPTQAEEPTLKKVKTARADSCPPGMTCIEDYTTGVNMDHFYEALRCKDSIGRPVRIAYYGDSFIEGDIFTDALREKLQDRFGAGGPGYIDVASEMVKLRPTVDHKADGWTDFNVMKKEGLSPANLSLSAHYAVAGSGAFVQYKTNALRRHMGAFELATLFVKPSSCNCVSIGKDGAPAESKSVDKATGAVGRVTVTGPMSQVRFDVPYGGVAYGVALENRSGIVVDNFSIRGCSGMPLSQIPESHLKAMNALRPYDLIIIHFGLNVANKKQKDYSTYAHRMNEVIAHFKRCMPQAALLVVSISDREDKVDGQLQTAPGVKELLAAQQQMAIDGGVAFWNLYEAMGGEGSIKEMAERKPAEARKDFTHINRRGGDRIADIFCRTLIHGFEGYKKYIEQ